MAANGKPLGFVNEDLNDEFFSEIAQNIGLKLILWEEGAKNIGYHLTTDVQSPNHHSGSLNGVYKYTIKGTDEKDDEQSFSLAVRSKLNSEENSNGVVALCERFGNEVHHLAKQYWRRTLNFSRASELEILAARRAMKDPHLAKFVPNVYHTILDTEQEQFVVVSDFISQDDILVGGDPAFAIEVWSDDLRYRLLKEFADFHAHYLENTGDVERGFGGALIRHPRHHLACEPWYRAILRLNVAAFPALYTEKRQRILHGYLDNLQAVTDELEAYPMTFVHNDAHTGNLWLRRHSQEGKSDLILFDWELCCIKAPQADLANTILCLFHPEATPIEQLRVWRHWVQYYQYQLIHSLRTRNDQALLEKMNDQNLFNRIFYFAVLEFFFNRGCLLVVYPSHTRPKAFDIFIESVLNYIEAQADEYEQIMPLEK